PPRRRAGHRHPGRRRRAAQSPGVDEARRQGRDRGRPGRHPREHDRRWLTLGRSPMADSRDSIRLLESRRYRAMCEGDAATLDQLLADSLVYTHSYGGADGKASYLDGIRAKKWVYRNIERPIEDIQVHGDA